MISESPAKQRTAQLIPVAEARIKSYKAELISQRQIIPGSIMLKQDTRKYFPHAVPKSTLSRKLSNKYAMSIK